MIDYEVEITVKVIVDEDEAQCWLSTLQFIYLFNFFNF